MIFDSIAIQVSESSPYFLAAQFKAGAFANGVAYLGGSVCGTASLSGTGDPLEVFALGSQIAEGAYIIDQRPCGREGVVMVYSGPMVKGDLPPCTIDRLEEQTFSSVDEAIASGQVTAMAFVSLDIYAEVWRRAGAKVGRKVGGKVVWV